MSRRASGTGLLGEGLGQRLGDELVLVDLVQGDRERLVVDGRVDQRADVVEQAALVEVGVVVVDLAPSRAARRWAGR
jgi:hypothetical protein